MGNKCIKDKYPADLKDFGSSIDMYLRETGHFIKSNSLQILDVIIDSKVALQYFEGGQIPKKKYRIPLNDLIRNKTQIRDYALKSDNQWLQKNILEALDNLEESDKLNDQLPLTGDKTSFCNGSVYYYGHRWSISHSVIYHLLQCPKTKLRLSDGTYCIVKSITGVDSYIMIFDCLIIKVKNSKVISLSDD